MNKYFDFTNRQLKFILFLSVTLVIISGYLFVRSNIIATERPATFDVYIGASDETFTGIFVLDPNTAPVDSLELLPGIGRVLADRIIEYRINNRFDELVDITEVKGIGPKLYERIKPYMKVVLH